MKLLQVVVSLDARLGGVQTCVKSLSSEWSRLGHDVTVLCLDEEYATELTKNDVSEFRVHGIGRGLTNYRLNIKLVYWLCRRASNFDLIVVHGIWQFQSAAVWASGLVGGYDYVLFPHGMLDPWFNVQYPAKHLKKLLYWMMVERWVVANASRVVFTADDEREAARGAFPCTLFRAAVAPLGIADPNTENSRGRREKEILFLSRLDQKKGLDLLIKAMIALWDEGSLNDYSLKIAGPGEDSDYVRDLKNLISAANYSARVVWTGMVVGEEKSKVFSCAEVYVLPSHQENFGLTVVEALAFGTPVLISNKVNIWREVVSGGGGLACDDTEAGLISLLRDWSKLAYDQRMKISARARDLFLSRYQAAPAAAKMLNTIVKTNFGRNNAKNRSI